MKIETKIEFGFGHWNSNNSKCTNKVLIITLVNHLNRLDSRTKTWTYNMLITLMGKTKIIIDIK